MFQQPSDSEIRDRLKQIRRIAVVGLSPNPTRPSYRVSSRMQRWGFEIVPVRPAVTSVLDSPAFGSLAEVPGQIDLVNVFRNASELDAIVDDCIALNLPALWIQQGIINESAAARAQAAGIWVVMDRCLMVEYNRLCL